MSKNYYEILGVLPSATKEEIKSSYKKLARKFHPDINKTPEAEEKFKEINSAADILLDDAKRRNYDILMGLNVCFKDEETTKNEEAPKKDEQKKEGPKQNKESFKFDFKKFAQEIKKEYENKRAKEKINGKDIYMEVKISPQEVLLGCERKINIIHTDRCPKCKGRRFVNGAVCPECNGVGNKITHSKIKVKIPKLVKNNAKIKLKGEGNKGQNGGIDGDLYLTVKIEGIERVLKEVYITPSEALFGTTINVKLEEGAVAKLEIPKNTSSGQYFEVIDKNKGNKEVTVQVVVKVPKDLSEEEKKLYKKLSEYDINKSREELF